ncbi:MAG TPA: hypothetical protein VF695_08775 [Sphingomonas sp.]
MMTLGRSAISFGCLSLLVGCAGVPQLYRPSADKPTTTLAPKVDDIVHQIACELRDASRTHLKGRNYLVTLLLTLQVDDTLHLTPSLSFINPLATAGTNSTVLEALDVGGERRRTFTTTMLLETKEFLKGSVDASIEAGTASPSCNGKKLYNLSGELGLRDIVRDGVASYLVRYGDLEVHPDIEANKTLFGSTVQFAVNRTVTALGPVWTMTTFKGPGGSAGLVNGKRLGTDTLIVTFALQSNDPAAIETALQAVRSRQEARDRNAERYQGLAAANLIAEQRETDARETLARQTRLLGGGRKSSAERLAAELATTEAQQARQRLDTAREELDRANDELERARAEARIVSERNERSSAAAALAGQSLLNTMILQNLNIQPR